MTDEIQNDVTQDVNVDFSAADSGQDLSGVAENATAEQAEQQEEKTLTQSQVNKLIAREKREAQQKTAREYEARMAQQTAQINAQSQQGASIMNDAQISQLVRQEAAKMAAEQQAGYIANAFESKMKQAFAQDPDFADDYDALNIEAHPRVLIMANELDNTADVIKEMAKNPSKFAQVLLLANAGSGELAKRELQSLSSSIKTNKAALQQKKAPSPLGQIKSSPALVGDGKPSVASFRSNPKYRG